MTPNVASSSKRQTDPAIAKDCLCHVDQQPCGIVRGITSATPSAKLRNSLAIVRRALPCESCREIEQRAEQIHVLHVRLGKHGQRILRDAAPHGEKAAIIAPHTEVDADAEDGPSRKPTRADVEAHRRAIRRLAQLGLVAVRKRRVEIETKVVAQTYSGYRTPAGEHVERAYYRRVIVRTPLGEIVARTLGAALTAGGIRWGRHREALTTQAKADQELVRATFIERLRLVAGLASYNYLGGKRLATSRGARQRKVAKRVLAQAEAQHAAASYLLNALGKLEGEARCEK